MALSKPQFNINVDRNAKEKINKLHVSEYNGWLVSEEILTFCLIHKGEASFNRTNSQFIWRN